MKRVRLSVRPDESELPTTFERVTESAEAFVRVEVVNWNVATTPVAFLLRVAGDVERFEGLLDDDEAVGEYELLTVSDRESYCIVTGDGTADARALWRTFNSRSLMTIPPATWNPDGSYTFTVVGRDADIQSAVDNVPDGVRVDVESVGGQRVAPDNVTGTLSERQREAVETAVSVGYYEIPRSATTADVAAELGCSTSTAAEHLRKAESKLIGGLFRA